MVVQLFVGVNVAYEQEGLRNSELVRQEALELRKVQRPSTIDRLAMSHNILVRAKVQILTIDECVDDFFRRFLIGCHIGIAIIVLAVEVE